MSTGCPKCAEPCLDDECGVFWCEACELAFYPWTVEQEASRLDSPYERSPLRHKSPVA